MNLIDISCVMLYSKQTEMETKLLRKAFYPEDKATHETDVYAYGLVLDRLANHTWSSLEGAFKKTLLATSVKTNDGEVKLRRKSVQNDFYEEVITPKILEV